MTESHDDARLWPASPFDLADAHRCPSCFALVSAPVCPSCGFALSDPRAPRVLEIGRQMLTLELSRQQLMDKIRLAYATAAVAETDAAAITLAPSPELVAAEAALDPRAAVHVAPAEDVLSRSAVVTGSEATVAGPADAASASTAALDPMISSESTTDFASTAPTAPAAPLPSAPSPGGDGPSTPVAVTASAPRRRLTVPVLLLIVGVALVGVAAVFFLLLAWFVAGIEVRALIIGGITLTTIVLASWLRRRDLGATAEGIGALGVGFLALDAWAVRANDLFGTGSTDAAVYTGISALVVAVACRVWARVSGLRGPDLAASLALPAGIAFLVGGFVDLPPAEAVTAGFLGAAAGGLAHALPAPWSAARSGAAGVPERLVLALSGVGALVGAAVTAAVATGDAAPVMVWSSASVAVLGAAHTWVVRPRAGVEPLPGARVVSGVASSLATATVGLTGWQLAFRIVDEPVLLVLVAPVLATAVAVALDLMRSGRARHMLLPAAVTAAVIGTVSILATTGLWLRDAQAAIAAGWTLWHTDAFTLPASAPEAPLIAVAAAVAIGGLMFAAPTLRRRTLCDVRAVVVAVLLLTAAARTAVPAVLVGMALLIAVAAVVGASRASATRARSLADGAAPGAAPPAAVAAPVLDRSHVGFGRARSLEGSSAAGAVAAVTAFIAGTAVPWLWLVGVAVAAAYPVVLRAVRRAAGPLAVVLALAPVAVGVVAAIIAPAALGAAAGVTGSGPAVTLVLLQWVALATLAVAAFARMDGASRVALAVVGYALTAVTLVWTLIAGADDIATDAATVATVAAIGEPLLALARGIALLGLLGLIALGLTRLRGHAVAGAALLAAPAVAALAHAALDMAGASDAGWAALVLAAGPVLVIVVTAAVPGLRNGPDPRTQAPSGPVETTTGAPPAALAAVDASPTPLAPARARTAADLGALLTGLCVVWGIAPDLEWALLVLVAIACAAASVTRGWVAAAAADPADDRFATRRAGAALGAAPRRLLVWPAVAAACAAWWAWLGAGTPGVDFTLESYAVPVTVVVMGFAAVLVRLRRRGEASVAVAAALTVGLVWPALADWWPLGLIGVQSAVDEPVHGTVVALVAAAVCLAFSLTPVRSIRPPSVVGATAALAALGLAAADLLTAWPAEAWPWPTAWLVLFAGVAYASGLGIAGARPERASSRGYAVAVPPIALSVAALLSLGAVDHGWVVAAALALLIAAHLAAAAIGVPPFARATRWTALAGAVAIAAWSVIVGGTREVEFATLPIAAACGAGAVLAVLRRRRTGAAWPAGEEFVWGGALVLATLPSLLGPAEPARVWLLIGISLITAAAIALTPIPDAWRVRVPSSLILSAAALAMGARVLIDPWFDLGDAAAITAAAGAVVVAVVLTATAVTFGEARRAAILAAVGVALLATTTLLRAGDDAATVTVIVAIAGAAGVAGAAALGLRRWAALGAVLAVGGLVVAAVGCGVRFLAVAGDAGFEADLWVVGGAGIAVAIALAALRATPSRPVALSAGAGLSVATVLFAAAEAYLLAAAVGFDELRTAVAMTALSAAAYVGAVWRGRLGAGLAVVAVVTAAAFGLLAFFGFGVEPVELVTVPAALGGIAYGSRTLVRRPGSRSWPSLGPWLALLLLPSLVYDFVGDTELWRIVALGVVAVGLVVAGAFLRLQAPLVLGSAVVLIHGVAQLWPWISTSYVAVPWWLWLGIGGAVLIFIAARYERRVKQLRAAITAVTSLR
ncbi:SCO7613 C-terminal domain-containing membrane protein [Microbacterium sp. NPDC056569]|uniref:SCO7613 C-terminal domain-containing membrane protein n=1 Tax=Microbacterium sp. NPDC056569 TaxID=3345867 RepID=UPI00366FD0F1